MAKPEETFAAGEAVYFDEFQPGEGVAEVARDFIAEYGQGPFTVQKVRTTAHTNLHPQVLEVRLSNLLTMPMSGMWFKHTRQ